MTVPQEGVEEVKGRDGRPGDQEKVTQNDRSQTEEHNKHCLNQVLKQRLSHKCDLAGRQCGRNALILSGGAHLLLLLFLSQLSEVLGVATLEAS